MQEPVLQEVRVWDRPVRLFHWINLVLILGLIALGLVIFNASAIGLPKDVKTLAKIWHIRFGYLFAINLLIRVIWGFFGSPHARWRTLFHNPISRIKAHISRTSAGEHLQYLGHNPLAKLMTIALFAAMLTMATTGMVLAGTDFFKPPLGPWIAHWVAAPGIEPSSLVYGDKSLVDPTAWDAMRAFRQPFKTTHAYTFYVLCTLIVLHIAAVIHSEIRDRSGVLSAMIHGWKQIGGKTEDES